MYFSFLNDPAWPSNVAQCWKTLNTIIICNIKSIWSTNLKKMAQTESDHSKIHIRDFWMIKNFPRKTAVYVSYPYSVELSCRKAKKSLEPFSRKTRATLPTVTSWNDWLNVSHVISTQRNHHRLHFWPVR